VTEQLLDTERAVIMGIVNMTVDSFSDGGKFVGYDQAVSHALDLVAAGADLIDVGGESTRPGAVRVPVDVEQERVLPVVRELTSRGVAVSVDTLNAITARRAIEEGARFINDVSGGLADEEMLSVVARSKAVYIAGHWRGTPATMNAMATYDDVVEEVCADLAQRVAALRAAGVPNQQVVLDPGLGFAKTSAHNWALLAHLSQVCDLGFPVLIGASRKRFIGELLPEGAPMNDRDLPSAVVAADAVAAGAWGVRVHDVRATRLALLVKEKWEAAS
jgi:dihydropteroate synthase